MIDGLVRIKVLFDTFSFNYRDAGSALTNYRVISGISSFPLLLLAQFHTSRNRFACVPNFVNPFYHYNNGFPLTYPLWI